MVEESGTLESQLEATKVNHMITLQRLEITVPLTHSELRHQVNFIYIALNHNKS